MIDCATAREHLLEAQLEELKGLGAGPLALHLRRCHGCAQAAALLLDETALLDEALGARTPIRELGALVRRAQLQVEDGPARRGRVGRRTATIATLAAAAAAAALWLAPGEAPPPPVPQIRPAATSLPVVETTPAGAVAVLPTRNPDITVVLFF